MKIRILLSLLFIITTTFATIHEIEHIGQGEDASCLVCHVSDNLASADVIDKATYVEIFHFEEVLQNNLVSNLHIKEKSNQNRAPPLTS